MSRASILNRHKALIAREAIPSIESFVASIEGLAVKPNKIRPYSYDIQWPHIVKHATLIHDKRYSSEDLPLHYVRLASLAGMISRAHFRMDQLDISRLHALCQSALTTPERHDYYVGAVDPHFQMIKDFEKELCNR